VLILYRPIVADVPPVPATVLTDPYCPWSWAAEPQLRRLLVEFGDSLAYTFVTVGLHRRIEAPDAGSLALACLDAPAESAMPVDPRLFLRDADAGGGGGLRSPRARGRLPSSGGWR